VGRLAVFKVGTTGCQCGAVAFVAMSDTLLQSLRNRMLNESEPLAGLLRKCLLLGAETGSNSLRDWARNELNGYPDDEDVHDYRQLSNVPISMDSISGNTWARGQVIDRFQLPREAWQYVPEKLIMRQSVEELERLAEQNSCSFRSRGLGLAQSIWNKQLGPFQSIMGLSYSLSGSTFAGLVGQIRTKLVDIVADLTSATPLTELPDKEHVDAAVTERIGHIGDIYTTTIHEPNGPTAIGGQAKAGTDGMTIDDLLRLLGAVQQSAAELDDDQRAELDQAVSDLRDEVEQESPDTGEVIKKAGKLRAVADKLGVAAVTAATSSATQVLTELAINGAFG
jgi:AbiTii